MGYGCKNKVSQMVEKGWDYKEIFLPCGSTGIHGQQLECDACLNRLEKQYPQGWRHVAGDTCKHGNYVGDAGGPDYLCGECEDGN